MKIRPFRWLECRAVVFAPVFGSMQCSLLHQHRSGAPRAAACHQTPPPDFRIA
jgi:hypothetical protein